MDSGDSEDETLKLNFAIAGNSDRSRYLESFKYENPSSNFDGASSSQPMDPRVNHNTTVRTHRGEIPRTGLN